ncbi:MAG: cytochrome ubiquinol oxidase subunit I [Acidobacteriota bacterium]
MDAFSLARAQFAVNMTFHILFPTISIGLAWVLFFMRWRWQRSHDRAWLNAYRFWAKVFALTFATGVVSGITMSFQFGTNWPGFMERVGNVAGPLLGYEVLTAFFLEATFLGVMLYGEGRVSERTQLRATFLVAFGTTLSAFWILSLNSWMQTPQGFRIEGGEFFVTNWRDVIFNPSFPYRLTHMLMASFLTVMFLMAGVSAWQVLHGSKDGSTGRILRLSLTGAAMLVPLQIVLGDLHGLNTLAHQPQKIAAMEALWTSQKGADLHLLAWPDAETRTNRWAMSIPNGAALILRHDTEGWLQGLNEFETHPPVWPLFIGFRVMVGMGVLMLLASWAGMVLLMRRHWRVFELPRPYLRALVVMTFSGWVATLAGWYVTEMGRQPYIVFGLLKTAEVASSVPQPQITLTLGCYLGLYVGLLLAYIGVIRYLAGHPIRAEVAAVGSPEAIAIAVADQRRA